MEVPLLSNCFPMICASGAFGSERNNRMILSAKCFVLFRNSSGLVSTQFNTQSPDDPIAKWPNPLPVYLAQHNINTADGRDHIGQQSAHTHLFECLQIYV